MNILQITTVAADTATTAAEPGVGSLFNLAKKGGITMIPIIILLFIAIFIIIERYLTIKKAGKMNPTFMSQIKDMVHNANIPSATRICQSANSPIARMIEKGLQRIGTPLKNIEVAVENVGKLEIYKLEKGMPVLATIAGGAPMLGFLGTVTGMIKTLMDMAAEKTGTGAVDVGAFSEGIYEAMVTTVAGLVVGIIAYFAYNLLTAQLEKVVYEMEASSVEFFDILQQPSNH